MALAAIGGAARPGAGGPADGLAPEPPPHAIKHEQAATAKSVCPSDGIDIDPIPSEDDASRAGD
jgi:hypothetical protein